MNGRPPPRPNKMPLIILAVVGVAVVLYFVTKKKEPEFIIDQTAGLPPADPCKGIPEWACATKKLLDPLAKTSVDIYKIKKGVYQPPQQY